MTRHTCTKIFILLCAPVLAAVNPVLAAAPTAPTGVTATAGNAQATLKFTAPTVSTGYTMSGYTASCTATGKTTATATATASPITVSSMTNGTKYSCSVKGTYTATSASSLSVTVVPVAAGTTPGTPTSVIATAGNASASIAFTAPTAVSGVTISSYTATCTSGSTSKTGTGTSSPITVSSLTNSTSYSCTVKATSSAGVPGTASTAVTVTPTASASSTVTYSTPANFTTILASSYSASSLTSATAFTTRSRYLISNAATVSTTANYLSIGSTYDATTGYTAGAGTLTSSSTYKDYLSKIVLAVSDSSGYFRLDSHLHPNDSIDADSTDTVAYKLKFRNNFGKAAKTYGYVLFAYDSTNKVLQAKKRYTYSYNSTTYAATYTLDSSFGAANYYVQYSSTTGAYQLVSALTSATKLYLYNSPLTMGVPSDFNPASASYVTNSAAAFLALAQAAPSVVEGTSGKIYNQVNSKYRAQVATAGVSTSTDTAADTVLAAIKATGVTLRYDTAVYAAFRKAALATKLESDSIADGIPGQNLVPYIWFTNEQDSSGVYHPFMVIAAYGNQASPNGLIDVPHPPGSGTGGYAESSVTRFANLGATPLKFPMKDYGTVSAVTENSIMTTTLWSDASSTTQSKDVYNFASARDNGILVNGAMLFPAYNNTLVFSQTSGELSPSGCHVGQGGGGPHCHADSFRSAWPFGFYSASDYVGKTHPPIIGFGYDGVALFGSYLSDYSSMLGYSTSLEPFGGHNHDSIGYHYHAHTVSKAATTGVSAYTLRMLMRGAYIGQINSVPCFAGGITSTCTPANEAKFTYGN